MLNKSSKRGAMRSGSGGRNAFASGESEGREKRRDVRAYVLADVAAEHPVAHLRAQRKRDAAFEFDGEVGDAARRIEHAGRRQGMGRTGGEAARAAAAPAEQRVLAHAVVRRAGCVQRRRSGAVLMVGLLLDDLLAQEHCAQEQVAAALGVNQAGVLADETEAAACRPGAFQDWAGVYVGA